MVCTVTQTLAIVGLAVHDYASENCRKPYLEQLWESKCVATLLMQDSAISVHAMELVQRDGGMTLHVPWPF